MKSKKIVNLGIASKIAISCGIVVLLLLFVSNYISLRLESNLVSSIVDQNKSATEKSIEEEGQSQMPSAPAREGDSAANPTAGFSKR